MGPILNCLDDFAKELGVLYAQTEESQVNDIVLILLCAQTEEVYRKTGGLLWLTERLKKKKVLNQLERLLGSQSVTFLWEERANADFCLRSFKT